MISEPHVPLLDLIMCLSEAMDLVSPSVVNHHKQVAYIAYSLADELGMSTDEKSTLVLAGALHDVGAFYSKEKLALLEFEIEAPQRHAERGYHLLKLLPPLADTANMVRRHHTWWDEGKGDAVDAEKVPLGSHIIHLADRIAVLINKRRFILGQVENLTKKIKRASGSMFKPELVEAFVALSDKEYFWLDVASRKLETTLPLRVSSKILELEDLADLTHLFARIIDFRSQFTATHSSGVAASAETIAKLIGFSQLECRSMRIAGYLHDLGKLAVSAEILEKPAKLDMEEVFIMRSHTYFTYRTLQSIADLEIINTWASFHHEYLDGKGYPFHIKGEDLCLGARVMAVADTFTAITEDRPYRKSMAGEKAVWVLQQMADYSKLDPHIVGLVKDNFDDINKVRAQAQQEAVEEHRNFMKAVGEPVD